MWITALCGSKCEQGKTCTLENKRETPSLFLAKGKVDNFFKADPTVFNKVVPKEMTI